MTPVGIAGALFLGVLLVVLMFSLIMFVRDVKYE